jgi:antitoxin ChpS
LGGEATLATSAGLDATAAWRAKEAAVTQTVLKKIDGATIIALPDVLLAQVGLNADSQVNVHVEHGRLVIVPIVRKKKYTLEQLMAQCDLSQPMSTEEREWLYAPRVGTEEI